MKKNIGLMDSLMRGLLGLQLLFVGLILLGGFGVAEGTAAVAIASVLILTAIAEYSPIYALLKINTRNGKCVPGPNSRPQENSVRYESAGDANPN